jgi:hypothetical protein
MGHRKGTPLDGRARQGQRRPEPVSPVDRHDNAAITIRRKAPQVPDVYILNCVTRAKAVAARIGRPFAAGFPLNLDSEVNFGEVAFPQRGTKKKQALYQGTASAVPERDDPDGL